MNGINEYRVYINVQSLSYDRKMWSALIQCNDKYAKTDYVEIASNYTRKGKHGLSLYAIYDCLNQYMPFNSKVNIYIDNDQIAFEWNEEYKKDCQFCSQTKDTDIWEKIIFITKRKKIQLSIYGSDSLLTCISEIGETL